MPLRIACDLDGTVADMDAALQREAESLLGPDVDLHAAPDPVTDSAEDVEGELAGETGQLDGQSRSNGRRAPTREELRRLWAHVAGIENFWRDLAEVEPGAVALLAERALQHRWDVLFVTQRPASAGETTQRQSQRWLQAHGFELPSVFVNGSRGRVAQALSMDAVLDDRPENCLDVVTDSRATPILVWRHRRDAVPPAIRNTRIEIVFSMKDALERLEQMTLEGRRRKTLLGRVRSAIGL